MLRARPQGTLDHVSPGANKSLLLKYVAEEKPSPQKRTAVMLLCVLSELPKFFGGLRQSLNFPPSYPES